MPDPSADDRRIRTLAELAIIGAPLDPVADQICQMTSAHFHVPMAFVSLIDAAHRHLMAGYGVDRGRRLRQDAICNLTIQGDEPLILEDTLTDPRTRQNPLVLGGPKIRFYVGIPLSLTPGVPIGAFCIADTAPRTINAAELSLLAGQAGLIMSQIRYHSDRRELARQTLELADKKAILSQAECLARLGGFEADPTTGLMAWTDGLHRIFDVGLQVSPTIERFLSVFPEGTQKSLRQGFARLIEDKGSDVDTEAAFTSASDRRRHVRIHAIARSEPPARRIVGVVQDVTERKAEVAELEWTATHDHLTKLLNRAAIVRRIEAAVRDADVEDGGIALITLDIDRFRTINDTLGHAAGDELLVVVAGRLRSIVGTRGLVARIGGDEFAVLVDEVASEGMVASLATEILLALRAPVVVGDASLDARATIGIASHSFATTCANDLLKEADIALTHARESGRDSFTFYRPSMREALESRAARLAVARAAVFAGRLEPWYQPKVDLGTNEILGFEALMRWHHPAFGLCGPDAMGDVFTNTEIAVAIGRFMLYRVVADMAEWRRKELPFGHVAINVAESEFYAGDYAERVMSCLSNQHLTSDCLEVEVTESVFLGQRSGIVGRTMRNLADAGISIALDDFGTGYASLTHLKQYPVSSIKIDRSFVADIEADADAATIVDAVTSLANSLRIGVVAEGIETLAQLAFLKLRGCTAGQGYLFAKAMPAANVPTFLRNWTASPYPQVDFSGQAAREDPGRGPGQLCSSL